MSIEDPETTNSEDDFLLLNPGPVPVSNRVRQAMREPMVSHRSAEFEETYERAQRGLDYVFTKSVLSGHGQDVGGTSLILNGTATMGMEMAVANLTERESEVVALVNGKFGRRFKRIAERHARVTPVEADWGASFDLDRIEAAIADETDLVTMVHNETSTGLRNPVERVGEIATANDALFVVDGVTSIGGDEFRMADWNVDVAITDAQKALAAPPGVCAIHVSERAAAIADGESAPFYEDMEWHLRKAADHQTPFTSAVPLIRALAMATEEIRDEGMAQRIRRHRRQARAFRDGFEALGLERFPDIEGPTALSNTVTAIDLPETVKPNPDAFFDAVAARDVSISGGQAHLGGEIFRVSNMGNLSAASIRRGVQVVGEALNECEFDCDIDAGIGAATEQLSE